LNRIQKNQNQENQSKENQGEENPIEGKQMQEKQIREKLDHCFSLTFPQIDPYRRASASVDNTAGWDSVAQVTLLTLIGEEFGIEIDFEEFDGATSFDALASRIQQILPE
jgi:acyl carrier protein